MGLGIGAAAGGLGAWRGLLVEMLPRGCLANRPGILLGLCVMPCLLSSQLLDMASGINGCID